MGIAAFPPRTILPRPALHRSAQFPSAISNKRVFLSRDLSPADTMNSQAHAPANLSMRVMSKHYYVPASLVVSNASYR